MPPSSPVSQSRPLPTQPSLQHAIACDLLRLYQQPIKPFWNLPNSPSDYFEILLRVKQQGRMISPVAFLDSLTEAELCQLDCWVFLAVCRLPPQFRYSVNLTTPSLKNPRFVKTLSQITSHRLILEITEHHERTPETIESMNVLQEFFPIMMDDMCAGYSSLMRLHDLPFDGIKIDGKMISQICTRLKSRAIVGGIMAIADDLNLSCVAEYVETLETWEELKRLQHKYAPGLTLYVQGYAVGIPEPTAIEYPHSMTHLCHLY